MTKEEIIEMSLSKGIDIRYLTEEESSKKIENIPKDEYSINDCIMVRTTDIFPMDKKVQTPVHGNALTPARSEIFGEAIISKIRSNYPEKMNEEEEKNYQQEIKQYEILFDITRSSIHFSMNGLVSSHMYGNFQNRNYIILEPFNEHFDDKSLVGLRVEDTYFNDDINLSKRAIVMINKESFIDTINNPRYVEQLQNFNIVVFEGNEEKAVSYLLHDLGYNSFTINNHGYVDGLTTNTEDNKMYNAVRDIAKKLEVAQDKHFGSIYQKEDFNKSLKSDEQRNKDYLYYLLENTNVDEDTKQKLTKEANNTYSYKMSNSFYVKRFVDEVGLDTIKILTQEYNRRIKEKVQTKSDVK